MSNDAVHFTVNEDRKTELQSLVVAENRTSVFLLRLSGGLGIAFVLRVLIGTILCILDITAPETLFSLITEFIICGLAFWGLRFIAYKIASLDLGERVEEELIFVGNVLRYSFRIRYHSTGRDRNVIIIPLDSIRSCYAEPSLGRFSLRGTFSSDYFARAEDSLLAVPSGGNLKDFVFYDYFTPSLSTVLTPGDIHTDSLIDSIAQEPQGEDVSSTHGKVEIQ